MKKNHHARRRIATIRRRAPTGASPGTLISDPRAAATVLSLCAYDQDRLLEAEGVTLDEVRAARAAHRIVWVRVTGLADVETIQGIGDTFGLHLLALEDVVNAHQHPKTDTFDDHLFITTRSLVGPQETEQIALFLGPGYVLTFQERLGEVFEPVRTRLRRGGRLRERGPDYLAYAILDTVIDRYFPAIEQSGERLEQIEDQVVAQPDPQLVGQIHEMKRTLLELRRAIWPQREMLNALIRTDSTLVEEATKIYLRDCYDHVAQQIDMIETYREIASGLLDIYLSSLSNRMNQVMKVLTVIATIFMPLSFVTGLYGMNFDRSSPWNMPELGWRYGYLFFWGVSLVVVGGLLYLFKRQGWVEPPKPPPPPG